MKALFGLENKNMKPSKKNDVLIKKKCIRTKKWYKEKGKKKKQMKLKKKIRHSIN